MSDNSDDFRPQAEQKSEIQPASKLTDTAAAGVQPEIADSPGAPGGTKGDAPAKSKKKRKHPFLRFLGWFFIILLGIPLLTALILLGIAFFSRSAPGSYIPQDFDFYASVPSASRFANEVIHLQALDTVLSTPETLGVRGLVRSLRVNPILRNEYFIKVADIRVDAALYADNSFVAVADMGLRSALSRFAPLFGSLILNRFITVENLSYLEQDDFSCFLFERDGLTIYAAVRRNLVIAASNYERFAEALAGTHRQSEQLIRALAASGDSSLRFLADPSRFTEPLSGPDSITGRLLDTLQFPSLVLVDLKLSDEAIGISFSASPQSSDAGLTSLLQKRSRAPAVLSRLPEAAEYFSLLALGSPEELWTTVIPFMDAKVPEAKASADKATKLAFGKTVDELLFSWMGNELGMFGTSLGPAPVFFVKVEDEKQRRLVFDSILSSVLVGRDVSAVVNGIRIPRIIFPSFITNFLSSLGIQLVEPFYVVEDGILYASASAETLGACLEQIRAGKLLVKSAQWEGIAASVSAESSAMVYYNLDRSLPFFLRMGNSLSDTLKSYNIGALSLGFRNGELRIDLSALRTASSNTSGIPGYPVSAGSRIDSDLITVISSAGTPVSYWTSGKTVYGMDLSSGERYTLEMDDNAYISAAIRNRAMTRLWAVSQRGTVYNLDYKLETAAGFPLLSGQTVSGPPAVSGDTFLVPIKEEASIMMITPDGTKSYSAAMYSHSRSGPAVQGSLFAVLPRSFDSWLFLFNPAGELIPNWPVQLTGIASASPLIVPGARPEDSKIATITESGDFSVYNFDGSLMPGFPISLPGVYASPPLWVPGFNAFLLISDQGVLWRITRDSVIQASIPLQYINGRNIRMTARDINNDGREEIFIGSDGNALMAFDSGLVPLLDFPLPGSGLAGFADIDGNGSAELIIKGSDDTINAYRLAQ
ncbi:MAG: VCBS repeat-containing protein [Spirochaetes bacterium]|nr:VCBS repeat-containing protein [Spirochaetota bacterium]MBU0956412.1 VCBS repeat-containing protein [Spirochaetota bacterium]